MISSNFETGSHCKDVSEQEIETRALIDYLTLFGGDVSGRIPQPAAFHSARAAVKSSSLDLIRSAYSSSSALCFDIFSLPISASVALCKVSARLRCAWRLASRFAFARFLSSSIFPIAFCFSCSTSFFSASRSTESSNSDLIQFQAFLAADFILS